MVRVVRVLVETEAIVKKPHRHSHESHADHVPKRCLLRGNMLANNNASVRKKPKRMLVSKQCLYRLKRAEQVA